MLYIPIPPAPSSTRVKRSSPISHNQRHNMPGSMYHDMNDEMMYQAGSSNSCERNLTPFNRHRADEGL